MLCRLQYRNAKDLMQRVNENRPPKESFFRRCLNTAAFAFFAPIRVIDWARRAGDRSLTREQATLREAENNAQRDDINLSWTMSTAFYALSGGCIHHSRDGEQSVLQKDAIAWLAEAEPETLLPLQRAALQSLGGANGVAKAVTCIQALWFCSQCIARLSEDLAVSLLELNTFAHCVSTLLIYMFWWDKPYEVDSYVFIESPVRGLATSFAFDTPILGLLAKSPNTSHRSTRNDRRADVLGSCLLKDESGIVLSHATYRFFEVRDPPDDAILLLPSLEDGTLQIPGTGFCLSFDSGIDTNWELYTSKSGIYGWRKVWQSWADLGFPLPSSQFPKVPGRTWRAHRSSNMDSGLKDLITTANEGILMPLIMTLTFGAYGTLHLLAWQYNFGSKVENLLWKIASIMTASTGVILLGMILGEEMKSNQRYYHRYSYDTKTGYFWEKPGFKVHVAGRCLKGIGTLVALINIVARAFLIVESLKALPNSPPSTYVVPNWAAYFPHI